MPRKTESKWCLYLGKSVCPKCYKEGYMYIKLLLLKSPIFVISHRHMGVCYINEI